MHVTTVPCVRTSSSPAKVSNNLEQMGTDVQVIVMVASHLNHTGRVRDLIGKSLKSIEAQTNAPDAAFLSVSFGTELTDGQQKVAKKLLSSQCAACNVRLVLQPRRLRQFQHYDSLLTDHVGTFGERKADAQNSDLFLVKDPRRTIVVFGDDDDVWHPERVAAYKRAAQETQVRFDAYQSLQMRLGNDEKPRDRTSKPGEMIEYQNYAVRLDCVFKAMQWLTPEAKEHRFADVAWSTFLASHPDLQTCAFAPPPCASDDGTKKQCVRAPVDKARIEAAAKDDHKSGGSVSLVSQNWMYWLRDHTQYPRARHDTSNPRLLDHSPRDETRDKSRSIDVTVTRSVETKVKSTAQTTTDFLSTVPVYVINMMSQTERLTRLKARLARHGLYFVDKAKECKGQVHVVGALTPESEHVKRMFEGWSDACENPKLNTRPQASYYSHVKAVKQWLQASSRADESTKSDWAMFLEDDAVLHDDFRDVLNGLWPQVPSSINMILLTHYVVKWDKIEQVTMNLSTMTEHVWGAQGYMVRRSWAESNIDRLDVPVVELAKQKMPCMWERILQSRGPTLFTRPVLVIEESLNSTIQTDSQLTEHLRYFMQFRPNFRRHECKQVLDAWDAFESDLEASMVSDLECFLALSLLDDQSQEHWMRFFTHRSGLGNVPNTQTITMWQKLATNAYAKHASKSPFAQARFFSKQTSDAAQAEPSSACQTAKSLPEMPWAPVHDSGSFSDKKGEKTNDKMVEEAKGALMTSIQALKERSFELPAASVDDSGSLSSDEGKETKDSLVDKTEGVHTPGIKALGNEKHSDGLTRKVFGKLPEPITWTSTPFAFNGYVKMSLVVLLVLFCCWFVYH